MLTAAYTGHSTIAIAEAEPAPPGPGQVQIRVAYTGLCGTDLHILHGNMDARVHDSAGLRPRDERHHRRARRRRDGLDRRRRRHRHAARLGRHLPRLPRRQPAHLPEPELHRHRLARLAAAALERAGRRRSSRCPPACVSTHAALVEPVAVAVHDVRRGGARGRRQGRRDRRRADRRAHRDRRPRVRRRGRRHRARSEPPRADRGSSASTTLDPRETDQVAWVEEWTGGAGADVVFEVSGAAAAVLGATALAKVRGTLVVVAIHPTPREIDLQRLFWRELRILGARVYQRTDFETGRRAARRRRHPGRRC